MSKLMTVQGFEGKDGKGRKIIVAHSYNVWGEDSGYGVWVLCENYKLGKMVKSWRKLIDEKMTKEEAIAYFIKRNKAA